MKNDDSEKVRATAAVPQAIREGDIVFNCPKCGKSLAIDAAGAGMQVPCTDCGEAVIVPYPGLEAEVLTPEEAERTLAEMDKALNASAEELAQLRKENEVLKERQAFLEHLAADNTGRAAKMSALLDEIQTKLDELAALVADARAGRPV